MQSINEPRLAELAKQVAGLEQRHGEQESTVASLRRELGQAREDDLNREALAVARGAGTDKPKPKAPELERALAAAEHDLEVVGRALTMARSDVSQYLAKNHEALSRKLAEAKAERARDVGELARPLLEALRGYYACDDDARTLKPYNVRPAEENHGEPQDTVLFAGVYNTRNVYGADKIAGLHRGELEGVVSTLVNLPAQASPEETIVGPVPEESEEGDAA